MPESWKDSLIDCIKSIEEVQEDSMVEPDKRDELSEVIVKLQEIMED